MADTQSRVSHLLLMSSLKSFEVASGPAPPKNSRLRGVPNDSRIHRRHQRQQFALAGAHQRSQLRQNQSQKRLQLGLSFFEIEGARP